MWHCLLTYQHWSEFLDSLHPFCLLYTQLYQNQFISQWLLLIFHRSQMRLLVHQLASKQQYCHVNQWCDHLVTLTLQCPEFNRLIKVNKILFVPFWFSLSIHHFLNAEWRQIDISSHLFHSQLTAPPKKVALRKLQKWSLDGCNLYSLFKCA